MPPCQFKKRMLRCLRTARLSGRLKSLPTVVTSIVTRQPAHN